MYKLRTFLQCWKVNGFKLRTTSFYKSTTDKTNHSCSYKHCIKLSTKGWQLLYRVPKGELSVRMRYDDNNLDLFPVVFLTICKDFQPYIEVRIKLSGSAYFSFQVLRSTYLSSNVLFIDLFLGHYSRLTFSSSWSAHPLSFFLSHCLEFC